MNDEANSHYYSILTQLTEGHLWVKGNVDVEPKYVLEFFFFFTDECRRILNKSVFF